jgi:DNA-binding NarL/FixJ family response regulator
MQDLRVSQSNIRSAHTPANIMARISRTKSLLPRKHQLTSREIEIMILMLQGKTCWEMASICELSAETVKKHVQNIYRKLQVNNRISAAIAFLYHQLGVENSGEH